MPVAPQSRRWCWTLNNPSDEIIEQISNLYTSDRFDYIVFGFEVAASGTRHLQGYFVAKTRIRLTTVKSHLSARVHAEIARGSHLQASQYCKKDGDYREYGTLPTDAVGTANQFDAFVAWVNEYYEEHGHSPGERVIAREYPALFCRYGQALGRLVEHTCPFAQLENGTMYQWQQELWNFLEQDPNDREILFYIDEAGGKGKTWFIRYFMTQKPEQCQVLSSAKRDDIAHAIDPTKNVFFFNIPRGAMDFLQYTILEQLKDRMVFSPKYNSQTKILRKTPHVVVFCNEPPDMTKMSDDRYKIVNFASV